MSRFIELKNITKPTNTKYGLVLKNGKNCCKTLSKIKKDMIELGGHSPCTRMKLIPGPNASEDLGMEWLNDVVTRSGHRE